MTTRPLFFLMVLGGCAAESGPVTPEPDCPVGLEVGDCAPDFTLPDRLGTPFTLSQQRGKVALVDISAVW